MDNAKKSEGQKTQDLRSARRDSDQDELLNLSSNVFKVRRTLLEQFGRIEREMEKRAQQDRKQFASRE